jgi:hypothetical protein
MLYCALIGVALAALGGPAKVGANETGAQKGEHLAALKGSNETGAQKREHLAALKVKSSNAPVQGANETGAQKREHLAALKGTNETSAQKLEHLNALKKELAEKQQELAHVEDEAAKLKGLEAKAEAKTAHKNSTAPKMAAGATEADRLLAGLDQIRKLKGTFGADDGETVGGAMSFELSHGNDIWGAIDSLVSAAAASKGDKKAGAALQNAMATFTSTVGKKLHEIDQKDTVQNEEYVLGLLAHHRHNATEQEWILANFTKVPAVEKLMKNHKKSGEYSEEFAAILDAEHPAAKQITSFLQRVM